MLTKAHCGFQVTSSNWMKLNENFHHFLRGPVGIEEFLFVASQNLTSYVLRHLLLLLLLMVIIVILLLLLYKFK